MNTCTCTTCIYNELLTILIHVYTCIYNELLTILIHVHVLHVFIMNY